MAMFAYFILLIDNQRTALETDKLEIRGMISTAFSKQKPQSIFPSMCSIPLADPAYIF